MIRGFIIGLARIIFWMLVFYAVTLFARAVMRQISRRSAPGEKSDDDASQKKETAKPIIEYHDIKDATFKDVPKRESDKPTSS